MCVNAIYLVADSYPQVFQHALLVFFFLLGKISQDIIFRCTVILPILSWSKDKRNKCEADYEVSEQHLILWPLFQRVVFFFFLTYVRTLYLYYVYDPFPLPDTKEHHLYQPLWFDKGTSALQKKSQLNIRTEFLKEHA